MPEAVANGERFATIEEVAAILMVGVKAVRTYSTRGCIVRERGKPDRRVVLQRTRLPGRHVYRGVDIADFIIAINARTEVARTPGLSLVRCATVQSDDFRVPASMVGTYPTHLEATEPRAARRSARRAKDGDRQEGGVAARGCATG